MPATLFNSGLLIKPATKISELSIDTDKSWALYPAGSHSPAWATGLSAFTQRRRFSLYGTTREDWYDVNWLYRKQFSVRQTDTDVCTGGVASASSEFSAVESAAKAFDNDFATSKWVTAVSYPPCWIKYDLGAGNEKTVTSYTITSGNDAPSRDPMNWTFEASNDNVNWTVLDTQIGQSFATRFQTKAYGPFINLTAYRYYRLNISANHGANLTQIEELEFCQDTPVLDDYQVRLRLTRSSGTDVAGQIFVDTACLATFADIRFTSEDGTTLIPHWIEGVSGNDCYVWIKLPYLPCRVYLYYGNAAAPSTSNGDNTFFFFDDFSGDLSKWDLSMPVGWAIVAGRLRSNSASDAWATIPTGENRAFECIVNFTADNSVRRLRVCEWVGSYNSLWADYPGNRVQMLRTPGDFGSGVVAQALVANTDYRYCLTKIGSDWRMYFDTYTLGVGYTLKDTELGWIDFDQDAIGLSAESATQTDFDNVIVRNIAATEPVFGISDQREIQTLPTTLYPMMLTVHYGSGTDSPTDVYLNNLCSPDFKDLRFTNNVGTKLHYFIDNYVDSSYALVWILFDTVPGAGATLDFWMYYGNSSAVTESDMADTFPLFSDGPDGTILDVAKWAALSGTWDVSAITDHWGVAVNAIRQSNAAAVHYTLRTVADILGDNVAIDCWARTTLAVAFPGVVLRVFDDVNWYSGAHGPWTHQRSLWKKVAAANTELASYIGALDLLWHTHSLRVNGTRLTYIQDEDTDLLAACDASFDATNLKLGLMGKGGAGSQYYTDVRVRPFYYQEPIFGNWQASEISGTYYGITNIEELAVGMVKGDIIVSDGTNLAIVTPGFAGTNLVAKDPGNLPVWEYPP
jgi:hypothetical protein